MPYNLDLKDKRLLWELDGNSRAPISFLAKKIKLSKEATRYRLNHLVEAGVIAKFYSVIDTSKLGKYVTRCFMKLQNTTQEIEQEVISWLVSNESVVYVESCDGEFDLVFGAWARNVAEYHSFLHTFLSEFGEFISDRQLAIIIEGNYYQRDYLLGKTRRRDGSFIGAVPEKTKIDEMDLKILAILGESARVSAVDISKKTKLSPDAVRNRIKRLESFGAIQGYVLLLNHSAIEQQHFKVLLKLHNLSVVRVKLLNEYCCIHPKIVYTVKVLGQWEFELNVEVKNVEQFRSILRDFKREFSDVVKDASYVNLYKMHKYNFCPSSKL